jgi:hypothetical protein
MTETTLLEHSIADVLKAIEAATDLAASKRTHCSSSLRQICAYLNRPAEIVPARWSGIKKTVYELHAARVAQTPRRSPTTNQTFAPHCCGSRRRRTCRSRGCRLCRLGRP